MKNPKLVWDLKGHPCVQSAQIHQSHFRGTRHEFGPWGLRFMVCCAEPFSGSLLQCPCIQITPLALLQPPFLLQIMMHLGTSKEKSFSRVCLLQCWVFTVYNLNKCLCLCIRPSTCRLRKEHCAVPTKPERSLCSLVFVFLYTCVYIFAHFIN